MSAAYRGGAGEPLVLLHGLTDTWRTWELVIPALERRHDVFAPALLGHLGGPPVGDGVFTDGAVVDAVERAMDEAGIGTAHLAGSSLGGYVALHLAARGRARSVVAFAPAGGWAVGDEGFRETLDHFLRMHEKVQDAAPRADEIASSERGRRRATEDITVRFEHIPADLVAHQIRGAAACDVPSYVERALRDRWHLDAERIDCPVRVVWGTEDRVLPWPRAAARYREEWLPAADWVVLDGVGHCPQLDVPEVAAELILSWADSG